MTELQLHHTLAWTVIATGALVFVVLFWITAPYGRHMRSGWGPLISSRLGWLLMESPAVVFFAGVYACGQHAWSAVPLLFCSLWLIHYTYRAFVYPLRLRSAKKPMPLAISALAIVFNLINAYLNARWLSSFGNYPSSWLGEPRCMVGVSAFIVGMAVNIHSDNILLALRKPGEQDYKIPQGGAFRWVSSPNYLAELIEWAGWALATWSLPGLAFFCFTLANLLPRAIAHHRWYHRTFADYPKTRRAIVPWLW